PPASRARTAWGSGPGGRAPRGGRRGWGPLPRRRVLLRGLLQGEEGRAPRGHFAQGRGTCSSLGKTAAAGRGGLRPAGPWSAKDG
ncbi:unnamed protein product, partial [Prorocentrum cordatum]